MNWLLGALGAAVISIVVLFSSLSSTQASLIEQRRLVAQRDSELMSLRDSFVALAESNEVVAARAERTRTVIREIQREPETTGCGPSVQRAVDSLRND